MHSVLFAAYNTVHDYDGGAEKLATGMKMSAAILRNKVNPNNTTHLLSLGEAARLMGLTGDYSILQTLAAEHGFSVVPIGHHEAARSLLTIVLDEGASNGNLLDTVRTALSDGSISANEMRAILDASNKCQAELIALVEKLGALVPEAPKA